MGALITPVHQGLVGPFEIERIDESFTQPLILELLPSCVEEPALRAGGRIVGDGVALDAPVTDRRKVVARRPDARGEFLPEQITFGGEPLEGNFAVAVTFVAHDVEIVVSTRDRQIGAPPILDPVVLDEAAGVEAPDLVETATERRLERRFVERMPRVIVA